MTDTDNDCAHGYAPGACLMPSCSSATIPTFADRLVLLDCETVTLDPAPGSVWEIAAMLPADDTPRVTQVRPDLELSSPEALHIGGFAHRYRADLALDSADVTYWLADHIPDGAVIVGSNPLFDIAHLGAQWPDRADTPPWQYHPLDLPSLVAGATGRWPGHDGSLSLAWAAETVGLDPDDYGTHTAAGDVLLARDIWRVVQGKPAPGSAAAVVDVSPRSATCPAK